MTSEKGSLGTDKSRQKEDTGQSTKVTRKPLLLTHVSDCCFFPNNNFSLFSIFFLPGEKLYFDFSICCVYKEYPKQDDWLWNAGPRVNFWLLSGFASGLSSAHMTEEVLHRRWGETTWWDGRLQRVRTQAFSFSKTHSGGNWLNPFLKNSPLPSDNRLK